MASLVSYAGSLLGINSNTQSEDTIQFIGSFSLEKNPTNGLEFNATYIPEEIWIEIFSNLSPSDILKCSLVCKNWHNIAKSSVLWQTIYNKLEYPQKAKNLPWYVFYCYFSTDNFKNLIKNGNGEEEFKYWDIDFNGGDEFKVESKPCGSPELPVDVPEFHGHTSCFATSYEWCIKHQQINLNPKKLLRYIIQKYHPKLYASEWFTARFDCSAIYKLSIWCFEQDVVHPFKELELIRTHIFRRQRDRAVPRDQVKDQKPCVSGVREIDQWSNPAWEKIELYCEDYPLKTRNIFFVHEGKDKQFWAGHYGSKMAGGVLKFLFESIEPIEEDMDTNEENCDNI